MNLDKARTHCDAVVGQIRSLYVGDELLIEKMLAAALANGHVLFEDNPGLGKTLLAKTLAFSIDCNFSRVQCTPDLLPADILGTNVWRPKDGSFELLKGPVFTNILLVDEVNRSPPKTQSAVMEQFVDYGVKEPLLVSLTLHLQMLGETEEDILKTLNPLIDYRQDAQRYQSHFLAFPWTKRKLAMKNKEARENLLDALLKKINKVKSE